MMLKFWEDKQCDKENIDPLSGMRAGPAQAAARGARFPSADGAAPGGTSSAAGSAGPGVSVSAAARILRDITPVFSDAEEEEKSAVDEERGAADAGGTGFIYSDEAENRVPAGGARAMGKPKRAQGAPSLSSLQKKLSQIDVSAENGSTGAVRGGKSHGKASRRTKQKQKRRGLRHANQNVRHGITSLR